MANESWVAIGAFVASAGSAIAAFFAVQQSVVQRKISIKPELITKDIEIKIIYINSPIFSCKPFNSKIEYNIDIPILNIGLGAALNIKYKWIFDYHNRISDCGFVRLDEHPIFSGSSRQDFNKAVYYDDDKDENQYLNFDFFNQGKMQPYSIVKVNKEIEFILPITQESEKVNLKLPTIIPLLVISKYDRANALTEIMRESLKVGELEIMYEDISGTKKSTQLHFSLRMVHFQTIGEYGPESVFSLKFHRPEKKSKFIQFLKLCKLG